MVRHLSRAETCERRSFDFTQRRYVVRIRVVLVNSAFRRKVSHALFRPTVPSGEIRRCFAATRATERNTKRSFGPNCHDTFQPKAEFLLKHVKNAARLPRGIHPRVAT